MTRFAEMWKMIPPEKKSKGYLAVAFIPLKSILDICGIALLIPVLSLVLESDSVFADYKFEVAVTTIVTMIVRGILCMLIIRYQNKYLLSLYRHYSNTMFRNLYAKGLLFVKESNSSELAYDINGACYDFATGYFSSIIRFVGDSIFCIGLIAGLLIADIKSTSLVFCAIVPIILIYMLLVKKELRRLGMEEFRKRRDQQKLVQETFKGYAEMQINGAYDVMLDRFESGLSLISKYSVRRVSIESLPGYLLEIGIAIVAALLVVFVNETQLDDMKLFLGVFAVAVMRMIPAIRELISTYNIINNTTYAKDVVKRECQPIEKEHIHDIIPLDFKKEIKVENLCFGYDDNPLLNNVNLTINKGDIFGFKGRTGSGKSTIFNLLLGLFPANKGSIKIDGTELTEENTANWQKRVGYVAQDVFIGDISLAENIALGCTHDQIDYKRIEQVVKAAELDDFVRELPDGLDTRIGEAGSRISGGQKQRIGIARALYKGADVLFFDEATSALDSETEKAVNKSIAALNNNSNNRITIIIIAHRETSLQICNKIFNIETNSLL
ncbi:MAG: ABC transporter ATP-binding protein/permease [Bacteroidaceae bacterium]|nr:ABC transporter ATP-binding protein/permease [Bacteroidaceae bacterium]